MAAIHSRQEDLSAADFSRRVKFLTRKSISGISLSDVSNMLYHYLVDEKSESIIDGLRELKAKGGDDYERAMSTFMISFLNTLFLSKGKREDLLEYAREFPEMKKWVDFAIKTSAESQA